MSKPASTNVTVIRNAAWVVGWQAESGHHYLNNADVAFAGGTLLQVGGKYEGSQVAEIDGRDLMVMPGLINIHSHLATEPLRKGITDEVRSPNFYHSSLYEYLTVFENDPVGKIASTHVAIAELLLSGCTTVVDFSLPVDNWLDLLADTGIRACIAPPFRDATWSTRDGHSIDYDWTNTRSGPEGLKRAKNAVEAALSHPSGRLSGMIAPGQIDTVTEGLLRDAHDVSKSLGVPLQTHAAQSINEFHEMIRRHGRSPLQWMDDLGVLDHQTIIAHGIFLDHHPWLHWSSSDDLAIMAKYGVTVAHCPTVFARRGIALNTFGRYQRAGVNMGIGTDTYPMNLLDEMRNALNAARLVAGTVDDVRTSDIFNAATLGGARALQREDIGRLAAGARADLVLVDLKHPAMRPLREPLRSLIYVAGERAVRDVFVDGQLVVSNGQCQTIDLPAQLDALEQAQQRAIDKAPELDYANRSIEEMAPMVFRET